MKCLHIIIVQIVRFLRENYSRTAAVDATSTDQNRIEAVTRKTSFSLRFVYFLFVFDLFLPRQNQCLPQVTSPRPMRDLLKWKRAGEGENSHKCGREGGPTRMTEGGRGPFPPSHEGVGRPSLPPMRGCPPPLRGVCPLSFRPPLEAIAPPPMKRVWTSTENVGRTTGGKRCDWFACSLALSQSTGLHARDVGT